MIHITTPQLHPIAQAGNTCAELQAIPSDGYGGELAMWPSVEAVVFGVFYNRIENSQMFTYYVSKEYRKTYKDLEGLGLLSDAISISYIKYQDYFALEPRSDHQIRQHLQILAQQTLTPLKAIKALLFLHAWMQATPKVGATEVVLEFLKSVLGQGNTICEQLRKVRALSERRVSKSAVLNSDWSQRFQQVEFSKEMFLLEDIVRPYVLYLQKIASLFDFYASLRRGGLKPLAPPEVWILMNLVRCVTALTNQLPAVCRFIRKSYRPIADALGESLSRDLGYFYPKLFKFCHSQARRIQSAYYALQNQMGEAQAIRGGIEGTQALANLLQDIQQLNCELRALYFEKTLQQNRNIVQLQLLEADGEEFEFVLHLERIRTQPELPVPTPKFYFTRTSQPSVRTEEEEQDTLEKALPPMFRDITNAGEEETITTFRKAPRVSVELREERRMTCQKRRKSELR